MTASREGNGCTLKLLLLMLRLSRWDIIVQKNGILILSLCSYTVACQSCWVGRQNKTVILNTKESWNLICYRIMVATSPAGCYSGYSLVASSALAGRWTRLTWRAPLTAITIIDFVYFLDSCFLAHLLDCESWSFAVSPHPHDYGDDHSLWLTCYMLWDTLLCWGVQIRWQLSTLNTFATWKKTLD